MGSEVGFYTVKELNEIQKRKDQSEVNRKIKEYDAWADCLEQCITLAKLADSTGAKL